MASISRQIRAARGPMLERAEQFDDAGKLEMREWVERDGLHACIVNLLDRAEGNAAEAAALVRENGLPTAAYPGFLQEVRDCVADFMNLGALVLDELDDRRPKAAT